jgi:hypothetical protein
MTCRRKKKGDAKPLLEFVLNWDLDQSQVGQPAAIRIPCDVEDVQGSALPSIASYSKKVLFFALKTVFFSKKHFFFVVN